MTPRAYGAGGRGERIRFTTVTTRLGVMLVAATDRGLCRVALGDDPAALEQRLRDEFPAADVRRDRAGLEAAASALRAAAAGQPIESAADARRARDGVSAPGLARVAGDSRWARRARTPRSPGRLAAHSRPAPSARACATNPVALAVPCHRVVPSAGGTGGYRWGSERKKKLLADEARNVDR